MRAVRPACPPGACDGSMVRTGAKTSFLQLSRREKDGTLVPKRDAQSSENGGDDPEDSAQESQPSFITQVRPVMRCQGHRPRHACYVSCALRVGCKARSCCPCCPLQSAASEAPPSVVSVRLQVTRESASGAAARSRPIVAPPETRATWRDRLRSLLCCLAPPATDQYYRSSESDAVALRPPAPVPPPRGAQQHVLGPIAPEVRLLCLQR